MRLLTETDGGRLCALGAGNCNDIDLAELLTHFHEIHLVDLDGDAPTRGVERQGMRGDPRIVVHPQIDVTGELDRLAALRPDSPIGEEDLARFRNSPAALVASLGGPFDVVASLCLLSQLVESIVASLGEEHSQFLDLIKAVREAHLRLLAGLAAPRGTAFLVTDIVSSDSCAGLAETPSAELPRLLVALIEQGNFFHGVNPAVLDWLLRHDLAKEIESVEPIPPWLWDANLRMYAVCAFRLRFASANGR
jgi:hypothetical protein